MATKARYLIFPKKATRSKWVYLSITTVFNEIIRISNPFSKWIYSSPPLILKCFSGKIILQITGSPLAAVNPMTVKCASLVADLTSLRTQVSLTSNLAILQREPTLDE
jgi:hypothetical protein